MREGSRIASASAGAAARDRERGPELAKHRPSNDHVGVLAGAPPANGPSGCNPSAPSPWCSPWPSSSPRRRTRCSSHRMCPPRTTTTQPTHAGTLLSVDGRRPLDAALEAVLDGCQAAACGSSVAVGRSSRRRPCQCLGVHRGPGGPALEVRTAVGRRAGWPPRPGRSARTHYRAGGALEPLGEL